MQSGSDGLRPVHVIAYAHNTDGLVVADRLPDVLCMPVAVPHQNLQLSALEAGTHGSLVLTTVSKTVHIQVLLHVAAPQQFVELPRYELLVHHVPFCDHRTQLLHDLNILHVPDFLPIPHSSLGARSNPLAPAGYTSLVSLKSVRGEWVHVIPCGERWFRCRATHAMAERVG